MKTCKTCNQSKPLTEFWTRKNCRPWHDCNDCRKSKAVDYAAHNKEKYKINKAAARDKAREFVCEYLRTHPCEVCGEADIVVLEFDHIDRTKKYKGIGFLANTAGLPALKREIEKCRVLCANCHRRHTAVQMGWKTKIT